MPSVGLLYDSRLHPLPSRGGDVANGFSTRDHPEGFTEELCSITQTSPGGPLVLHVSDVSLLQHSRFKQLTRYPAAPQAVIDRGSSRRGLGNAGAVINTLYGVCRHIHVLSVPLVSVLVTWPHTGSRRVHTKHLLPLTPFSWLVITVCPTACFCLWSSQVCKLCWRRSFD